MASTGQPNLRVRISADLKDIRDGLALLRGELAKVKTQANQALAQPNSVVNGLRRVRAELAAIAATYVSLRGASVLSGLADEATQIRGRIRAAKGDYESILAIAQRTRSGLAATTDLYARMERSTRGMDLSQQRLLQLTESVNQAIRLSYTSAGAGEAAVMQFGQALAAGELRGEELNSVLEQTPRLAEAVAAGMGVAVGDLKKMAKEGELAAADVLKAVESQSAALEAEFSQMPVTVGDAFTQLRNSFVDYVGDADEATGASQRLAQTIQRIAQDLPKYLDPVLNALRVLVENISALVVFLGARLLGGAIAGAIAGFVQLRAVIASATTATITLRTALLSLGGPVGVAVAALAAGLYLLYRRTTQAERAAREHNEALRENARLSRDSADAARQDAEEKRRQAIETVKAARAALAEAQARMASAREQSRGMPTNARTRFGDATGPAGNALLVARNNFDQAQQQLDDWTKRLVDLSWDIAKNPPAVVESTSAVAAKAGDSIRGVASAAELTLDTLARQLKELDRLFESSEIGIADYYAKRTQLQLASIDSQIAQAQEEARSAKSSQAQSKALTEIVKLQRERAEIGPTAAREQAAAEASLAAELDKVRERMGEGFGQSAAGAAQALEREFADLRKRLTANGDADGLGLLDRFIGIESSRVQLQTFANEAEAVMGRLRSAETAYGAQVAGGLLGSAEGERRLQALRSQSVAQLRELRERTLAYLATLDPGSSEASAALDYLNQLAGSIGEVASAQRRLAQEMEDSAVSSVATLFADLADGVKSAKDAFQDFVDSFVRGIARILQQKAAEALVNYAMNAMGVTGGKFHSGGVVGSGGTLASNLNPMLFGAAPRYHTGGFAGLGADEVAAVLERGEEVITERDPRHTRNGGRRAARGYDNVIINNNTGTPAKRDEQPNMAGGKDLVVTIGEIARDAVASDFSRGGKVARSAQAAYGLTRQGVLRG